VAKGKQVIDSTFFSLQTPPSSTTNRDYSLSCEVVISHYAINIVLLKGKTKNMCFSLCFQTRSHLRKKLLTQINLLLRNKACILEKK